MSRAIIAIRGPALRCAIIAALLARQWSGLGRRIVVKPDWSGEGGELLLRPGFARFHGEIRLDGKALGDGRVAFAYDVDCGDGTVSLPFAPFGIANRGVAFHHYWRRAEALGEMAQLTDYALALALHEADRTPDKQLLARLRVEQGVWVGREAYARTLLAHSGVEEGGAGEICDLAIDCDAPHDDWIDNTLRLHIAADIPGIEWLACVNAARRIVRLAADLPSAGPARREYLRLARHEHERIADMRALLAAATPTPALERKVALFTACGRIPMEDFEVFTQPEWLAALWAKDHRPARHDRMADAMPPADLTRWLRELGAQIRQLAGQGAAA